MAYVPAPTSLSANVAVVIAAYNAASTIGRAVSSALSQPEVCEVIVVDDASRDDTAQQARDHDDGSGRLSVLQMDSNAGPSAARNHAIASSKSPNIALLDADDFFLPGRFAALFRETAWDLVADNIVMVREDSLHSFDASAIGFSQMGSRMLTPDAFVKSCLTRRGRYRGELAFLKPVMRRAFLDAHRLRYDRELRLAEDFALYTRALMAGARFLVVPDCGYVAVERASSLSATHNVADLGRFAALDRTLLSEATDPATQGALAEHLAQTHAKYRHRAFLATKADHGLVRALLNEAARPRDLLAVAKKIASDKLRARVSLTARQEVKPWRMLIEH